MEIENPSLSEAAPLPSEYDVSGNVIIIYPDSSDFGYQEIMAESVQEIRSTLSDSDPLTNSVFVRYSLSCTLIICLVFLVFNHKR